MTELRHHSRVSQSHITMSTLVQKFAPQIVCWGITSLLCQAAFPLSKLLWIVQSGQKTVPVWKLFHKYPKWANCYQYKLTDLCQNELGTEATNGYRRDAAWQWQVFCLYICCQKTVHLPRFKKAFYFLIETTAALFPGIGHRIRDQHLRGFLPVP